jgi:hypothetical protein
VGALKLLSESRAARRARARSRPPTVRRLDDLLRAETGDAGCTASEEILDAYVELELAGEDPARVYPGTAIHLRSCPGCRADHDGIVEAARGFGGARPE